MNYYILDEDGTIQATRNLEEFEAYLKKHQRHVGLSLVGEPGAQVRIATRFLGVTAGGGVNKPALFETVVTAGPRSEKEIGGKKCHTFEEALQLHADYIAKMQTERGSQVEHDYSYGMHALAKKHWEDT